MERSVILVRHGRSIANATRRENPRESRIQGADITVPLDARGEWQARAAGLALGRYVVDHNLNLSVIHTSDALRAIRTRDIAVNTGSIDALQSAPDARLRELCKGELEGRLRDEVYIGPDESTDWHYRYGSAERGGETPYEAGVRWHNWFHCATQPDLFPSRSTIMTFGHNGVTAYGLWLLTHPGQALGHYDETEQFRVDNGAALVVVEYGDRWHVADNILPIEEDFEKTKEK